MRRRRRTAHMPEATINVTSLLDVVFVLLIAFMVVAPAMQQSVNMKLPKARESSTKTVAKTIRVEIGFDKTQGGEPAYYVNGARTERDSIASNILELPEYKDDEVVSLRADRSIPWEEVAAVISDLKRSGIENLGIVTEKGG